MNTSIRVYRERWWCTGGTCKFSARCDRCATPAIREAANREGYAVATASASRLPCYKREVRKKNDVLKPKVNAKYKKLLALILAHMDTTRKSMRCVDVQDIFFDFKSSATDALKLGEQKGLLKSKRCLYEGKRGLWWCLSKRGKEYIKEVRVLGNNAATGNE